MAEKHALAERAECERRKATDALETREKEIDGIRRKARTDADLAIEKAHEEAKKKGLTFEKRQDDLLAKIAEVEASSRLAQAKVNAITLETKRHKLSKLVLVMLKVASGQKWRALNRWKLNALKQSMKRDSARRLERAVEEARRAQVSGRGWGWGAGGEGEGERERERERKMEKRETEREKERKDGDGERATEEKKSPRERDRDRERGRESNH